MSLEQELEKDGARFAHGSPAPDDFGDARAELRAARGTCALVPLGDRARIRATGPDILDFLHRMSTADLRSLSEDHGRPTVLTTAKGRIVERLFVHHLGREGVVLIGGPGSAARVIAHLERFVFSEVLGLSDVTAAWVQLALLGPLARPAAERAGLPLPREYDSASAEIGDVSVHVLGHDGLSASGISVVIPGPGAEVVWRRLREVVSALGGCPAGKQAGEAWRILSGLPQSGAELTEEYNPLEAGLWDAVSFDKGCYVGQEVVARLRTYDKVTRDLRGFVFRPGAGPPSPAAAVLAESRRIGELTSVVVPPGSRAAVGMGYVKRGTAEPGAEVAIGELPAMVVELPFQDVP
jgi:folate-binding protein YgfZ